MNFIRYEKISISKCGDEVLEEYFKREKNSLSASFLYRGKDCYAIYSNLNNNMIGCIACDSEVSNNKVYICWFEINEENRSMGYGTQAIRQLCNFYQKTDYNIIECTPVADAVEFWKNNGFVSDENHNSLYQYKLAEYL